MVGGVYADSCNLTGHKGIELLTYNLCQQLRAINRIHGGTLYFFGLIYKEIHGIFFEWQEVTY